MAEDYVCGECGQVSENDYCPICESKMMKLGDFDDDMSYEIESEEEDDDGFETMDDGGYGLDDLEEGLPNAI
ncbi:MAG: hypothetical protein M1324_00660 [Patescibacteria group bacterium]|nr:hypothetical protein [Patescibacteria group bacterium]